VRAGIAAGAAAGVRVLVVHMTLMSITSQVQKCHRESFAFLQHPSVAILQQLSSLSDLYIRLYDNGRFWVEVLNWWSLDISIHDHDFF
ncbi:MAG: hypothetical protein ACRD4J_07800, partial [Nitrososphaeraceae archaeon]